MAKSKKISAESNSEHNAMHRDEGILLEAHVILSTVLEHTPTGVIIVKPDLDIYLANNVASTILDFESNGVTSWRDFLSQDKLYTLDEVSLTEESDPICTSIKENRRVSEKLRLTEDADGLERYLSFTAFPVNIKDRGEIAGAVAVILDMTDMKDLQDTLYYQATHDPLTGLSNRALFMSSLNRAFAHSKRNGTGGAVLMFNVDRFKAVNEEFGHASGDELLLRIADRVRSEVRETDVSARISGDEFAIMVPEVENLHLTGQVAKRICEALSRPFTVRGKQIHITVSAGVSFFPEDAADSDKIISCANAAMHTVKDSGRNGWRFWKAP